MSCLTIDSSRFFHTNNKKLDFCFGGLHFIKNFISVNKQQLKEPSCVHNLALPLSALTLTMWPEESVTWFTKNRPLALSCPAVDYPAFGGRKLPFYSLKHVAGKQGGNDGKLVQPWLYSKRKHVLKYTL